MRTILWLLCFVLYNLGAWELLRRNTTLREEYLPSLAAAGEISLLFMAGILNCLLEMTILLWGLGLGSFLFYAVTERSLGFLRYYRKPAFLFLGVFAVLFLACTYGKVLVEYDNFTHWAVTLKCMLEQNHFPDYRTPAVSFQAYPLGATVYLYFGLRFPGIGMRENFAMFLQALQMAFYGMPLFTRVKKNQRIGSVLMYVLMTCLLSISDGLSILDLRVDTVLPLAAGCMLLYIHDYCLDVPKGRRNLYLAVFYLVAVTQIKNSAILYAGMGALGILTTGKKDRHISRLVVAAAPFASWFLWRRHYGSVYPSADFSPHAMNLTNYARMLDRTPSEGILAIVKEWAVFGLNYSKVLLCLGSLALMALVICLCFKEKRPAARRLLVFAALFYVVYQVGMLGMYIFSMGSIEGQGIPGAPRYTNSALVFINYMSCDLLLTTLSDLNPKRSRQLLCMVLLMMIYPLRMLVGGETPFFALKGKQDFRRVAIQRALKDNGILQEQTCCMLITEEDDGYANFVVRYLLSTDEVHRVMNASPEDLENISEDFVMVLDTDNPNIQAWLPQHPEAIVVVY